MLEKDQIQNVIEILDREFPDPQPPLNFTNNFELLIAVMLSAQCTDERVNKTTPHLFPKYNTPEKMLTLELEALKKIVFSCGYHNQKAKNILACSQQLIERHNSQVPNTMENLSALSGVGTKTAGVVLAQAFNIPSFPVDTHVFRLANRIGLVNEKTRDKTHTSLEKRVPKQHWIPLHLQLIFHGRKTCKSQKPRCNECPLKTACEWEKKRKQ
jgi:endonuclease III